MLEVEYNIIKFNHGYELQGSNSVYLPYTDQDLRKCIDLNFKLVERGIIKRIERDLEHIGISNIKIWLVHIKRDENIIFQIVEVWDDDECEILDIVEEFYD